MNKKLIAVTGFICSGKTYFCDIISKLGYKIFYCDRFVDSLYKQPEFLFKLKELIPSIENFDKNSIANNIFNSKKNRELIENLIHPMVKQAIIDFRDNNKKEKLLFVEIPLLIKSNTQDIYNKIITITCNESDRKTRAMARAGINEDLFEKILSSQTLEKQSLEIADYIINSSVNHHIFISQVKKILEELNNDPAN